MVIPLPSPATTAGTISRTTRRAGPVFAQGGVSRHLFGTTKPRSCVTHMDVGNAASPPGAGAALASRKNRLRRGHE
jgi:hypothetical protein